MLHLTQMLCLAFHIFVKRKQKVTDRLSKASHAGCGWPCCTSFRRRGCRALGRTPAGRGSLVRL